MINGYSRDEILTQDVIDIPENLLAMALASIKSIEDDGAEEKARLCKEVHWIGRNLLGWGLSFEGTKRRIVNAARYACFCHDKLPALIDRLLMEGVAESGRDDE